MISPVELAIVQIATGTASIGYFLYTHLRAKMWCKIYPLPTRPALEEHQLPTLSIIVCVRNEEQVIAGKLDDLDAQNYPREKLDLTIVDTGSTDSTCKIINEWLASSSSLTSRTRLIRMTSPSGKSAGVNRGLSKSQGEVVLLTDADARLTENSLQRAASWLTNPEIGAVCGRQIPIGVEGFEIPAGRYRTFYNTARECESRYDSTPIFEGSLAAYRRSEIESGVLAQANADDSQLALNVRRNGLRAIHDPKLRFFEGIPISPSEVWRQKLRRAQGLQRHLWRSRDLWFGSKGGKIASILRTLAYNHLVQPILFLTSFFSAIALCTQVSPMVDSGWPVWLVLLNSVLLIGLIIPHRLFSAPRAYLYNMWVLQWSLIRNLLGRQSHIWQPVGEVRDAISKWDNRRK